MAEPEHPGDDEADCERDHRLRIIFSNGLESDPLLSSFRKALADDPTARTVHRHGVGPLDPDWEADRIDLTGTVYVLRSKSAHPYVDEHRNLIHKIGVTGQPVAIRIANARNDPTFLLADVEVVAEYRLYNINRTKLENLIHRALAPARLDLSAYPHLPKTTVRTIAAADCAVLLPKKVA